MTLHKGKFNRSFWSCLIQLYRKHLSQYYLDFCVLLFPRYTPAIGKWNIHVFVLLCLREVFQPSHLQTWLWCQLLLPWWLCPPTVDSDFLARSPCPLPCCEDCLEYGQILLRRNFFSTLPIIVFTSCIFSSISSSLSSFVILGHKIVFYPSLKMSSLGNMTRLAATLTSPYTALKSNTRSPLLSAPESVILSELPGSKISIRVDKSFSRLDFTFSRILEWLRSRVPSPWEPSLPPACHC